MDILLAILNRPEFYQLYCMRFFFVESIYDLDQPGHSSDNIRGGFNNPFITLTTNALGFYVICQTKDQSVAVIMVQEKLFYLYQVIDFLKSSLIYTAYIFCRIVKTLLTKIEMQAVFSKTNI